MRPLCGDNLVSLIRPQPPQKISLAQTAELLVRTSDLQIEPAVIQDATVGDVLAIRVIKSSFPSYPVAAVVNSDIPVGTKLVEPMVQLTRAAAIISERGVFEEGIFRLTKSLDRPEELSLLISAGIPVDMENDTPYDLASMLKIYTRKYHPNILSESDINIIMASNDCSQFLAAMEPERRQFLALLGSVCRTIDAHQTANKMSMSNLARVFAPNFFQNADPMVEMRLIVPTIEVAATILSVA